MASQAFRVCGTSYCNFGEYVPGADPNSGGLTPYGPEKLVIVAASVAAAIAIFREKVIGAERTKRVSQNGGKSPPRHARAKVVMVNVSTADRLCEIDVA